MRNESNETDSTDRGRELPPLYHLAKDGSIHAWKVTVVGNQVITTYGTLNGQKQHATRVCVGKNIGRSNETSPQEQANLEAKAMWRKKLERNYSQTIEGAERLLIRPMLAADFNARKGSSISYPVYVQPKLDGVRAVAYWEAGRIEILSRAGKSWRKVGSIEHIACYLESTLERNLLLDGEIYAHGKSFQQTTRLVKKYTPGESEQLILHVYDVLNLCDLQQPFEQRLSLVEDAATVLNVHKETATPPIQIVPTSIAKEEQAVYQLQSKYLRLGYEGAIVRLPKGSYRFGVRSYDLLKVKSFRDSEFQIVDVKDGVGRFVNAAIFVCETDTGKRFSVTSQGSMEERRHWFENRNELIGQFLKVKYFELSEDGIPRFPVGIGIRPLEDL